MAKTQTAKIPGTDVTIDGPAVDRDAEALVAKYGRDAEEIAAQWKEDAPGGVKYWHANYVHIAVARILDE